MDKWAPMSDEWWKCIIESRGTPHQLNGARCWFPHMVLTCRLSGDHKLG